MDQRELKFDDGAVAAELVIHAATALIGARRVRLRVAAQAAGETDPDRGLLRLYTFPDLIAPATGTVAGVAVAALDFETFIGLPEQLLIAWEQTVYDLNAHWLPEVLEEAKKEAAPSTNA